MPWIDDDFFFGERPNPGSEGLGIKDGRHEDEWREFSLLESGRVWNIDILLGGVYLGEDGLIGRRSGLAGMCTGG